ncbi:hypothetical protein [Flavobacterium sp. W21_SRS_FM6]|uniref:hypothetical protein n=1 Tax=Flavobacterium sp. W21_SRS_FM6 TaxID=3240268 RepID=UPI003F935807
MQKPFYQKNATAFTISIVVLYSIIVTDVEIERIHMLFMINLSSVLFALHTEKKLNTHYPNMVENPLRYVRFENNLLWIGDTSVNAREVQKIALDSAGKLGYCSLPFNQESGGVPQFSFPAEDIERLRAHFKQVLANVEFIT